MFLVCCEIFNFIDLVSSIKITWGGILVEYGVKFNLVHGYFITAYFFRIIALAAVTKKPETLKKCAPFKL